MAGGEGGLDDLVAGIGEVWGAYRLGKAGVKRLARVGRAMGILEDVADPGEAPQLKESQSGEYAVGRGDVNSLDQRIAILAQHIRVGKLDPTVQMVTGKLLARRCDGQWAVRERDSMGELRAIYNGVRDRVRFQKDPVGVDTYKSAKRTLEGGFGDCANSAVVAASMFQAAGYKVRLRVVEPKGGDELHVYTIVQNPDTGKWLGADASEPRQLGWEPAASRIAWARTYDIG